MAARKESTPPLEQALLADVAEHPQDDTPRLVYADWLQDQSQTARGEFIRAQVELERLAPDDPRREELEDREAALLVLHRHEWLARLPPWARDQCDFRRGFPGAVQTTAADLTRLFKRFQPEVPWESLGLTVKQDEALALPPQLASARPRRLAVWGSCLGAAGMRELVRSTVLASVEELDLSSQGLGAEALRALVEAPSSGRLRRLCLSSNSLGDEGATLLAAWPALETVQALDLSYTGVGPAGLAALTRSPHLLNLTALALTGNPLGIDGIRALACSELVKRLRELNLSYSNLQDEELEVLAQAPQGKLARLKLDNNSIDVEGVQALAAWAQLPLLETLSLAHNPLRRAGLRALLAGRPERLRTLHLDHCELEARGAQALAATANLPALVSLHLSGNELHGEGIQALATAPLARQLTHLAVGENRFPDDACAALGAAPLENLVSLDLTYGYGRDDSLAPLLASPHLQRLRSLVLTSNCLNREAIQLLADSPLLAQLTDLALGSNSDLRDDSMVALANSPNVANLRALDLNSLPITDEGVGALASSRYLTQLRSLNLWYTSVRSAGVRALVSSSTLGRLRNLELNCRLGVDDVQALAASAQLRSLVNLCVSGHGVNRASRAILRHRFGLRLGVA